jgi:hypothetical protein
MDLYEEIEIAVINNHDLEKDTSKLYDRINKKEVQEQEKEEDSSEFVKFVNVFSSLISNSNNWSFDKDVYKAHFIYGFKTLNLKETEKNITDFIIKITDKYSTDTEYIEWSITTDDDNILNIYLSYVKK